MNDWIKPDWQAPPHVHAIATTRMGGVSLGQYASMNPASHVHDDEQAVIKNRLLLQQSLGLNSAPFWLDQCHSIQILDLDRDKPGSHADGSTTVQNDVACVVMTADCLPVLLTDKAGRRVAALHAGWRGLADGILEAGVKLFSPGHEIIAWLGPAIGPQSFEVGGDVVEQLTLDGIKQTEWCQKAGSRGKWLVDIYRQASLRLQRAGVVDVTGGGYCTFTDDQQFFSYRRQGDCGRMASLIWLGHQADDGQISPS